MSCVRAEGAVLNDLMLHGSFSAIMRKKATDPIILFDQGIPVSFLYNINTLTSPPLLLFSLFKYTELISGQISNILS